MFKLYCRIYQFVIRIVSPFLRWRQPTILHSYLEVVNTLKAKGKTRVLLVSDKGLARLGLYDDLVHTIERNGIDVTIFNEATPNPTISQAEAALELYRHQHCQAIIGFGGGSPLDVAKVVAAKVARPNKPIAKMKGILKVHGKIPLLIAVPTTAGTGSEATLAAVIIDEKTRSKYAINDPSLFPHYALLFPQLTVGLPAHITAETGMDTLTHAIEAYIGKSNTKLTRTKAINAVHLVFKYLPTAYQQPSDLKARKMMQIAAYDAGVAFTRAYVGNIHALSHPLSAFYGLPHGKTNATILPYVLEVYGKNVYRSLADLARKAELIDNKDDEQAALAFLQMIRDLNVNLGIPNTIKEIKDEDLKALSAHAYHEANPLYPVPVIFNQQQFIDMYLKVRG